MNEWWSQLPQQQLDALYGQYMAQNPNTTYQDWMGLLQSGQLNNFYNNPQMANWPQADTQQLQYLQSYNPLSKEGFTENPDVSPVIGWGYNPIPKMGLTKSAPILEPSGSLLANPVANSIPSTPILNSPYMTDFRNQLSNIQQNGLMSDIASRTNATYTNVQGGQAADVLGKHVNADAISTLKTTGLNFAGELVKDMEKERTAYQAPTQSFSNIAGSALQGAAQGSKFGPVGTAVGAIAGGITGFAQRQKQIKQWNEDLADTRSAQLAANTGAMRDYQRAMYGYNSTGGPSVGPYAKYGGEVDAIKKMEGGGPTDKNSTYTKDYTRWGTNVHELHKAGKLSWEDVLRTQAARSQEVYALAQQLNLPHPEAVTAQFVLESGWGDRTPAQYSVFGIKDHPAFRQRLDAANIPYIVGDKVSTGEYINGKKTTENSAFLGFPDLESSVRAYAQFLNQPRYAAVKEAANPQQYLQALRQAGYSTNPNYVKDSMGVISSFDNRRSRFPMEVYVEPQPQTAVEPMQPIPAWAKPPNILQLKTLALGGSTDTALLDWPPTTGTAGPITTLQPRNTTAPTFDLGVRPETSSKPVSRVNPMAQVESDKAAYQAEIARQNKEKETRARIAEMQAAADPYRGLATTRSPEPDPFVPRPLYQVSEADIRRNEALGQQRKIEEDMAQMGQKATNAATTLRNNPEMAMDAAQLVLQGIAATDIPLVSQGAGIINTGGYLGRAGYYGLRGALENDLGYAAKSGIYTGLGGLSAAGIIPGAGTAADAGAMAILGDALHAAHASRVGQAAHTLGTASKISSTTGQGSIIGGLTGTNKKYGGSNKTPQYETEGGEVILSNPGQKPISLGQGTYKKMNMGGQLHKAVGPKHTNGGIPTAGGNGGYVFSDAMKFDASAILNMLR
jgi:hypothetical protein